MKKSIDLTQLRKVNFKNYATEELENLCLPLETFKIWSKKQSKELLNRNDYIKFIQITISKFKLL